MFVICKVKMYSGSSSLTPLAPISMHEMKIETTRILEPALSPYHSGEKLRRLRPFKANFTVVGIWVKISYRLFNAHFHNNTVYVLLFYFFFLYQKLTHVHKNTFIYDLLAISNGYCILLSLYYCYSHSYYNTQREKRYNIKKHYNNNYSHIFFKL